MPAALARTRAGAESAIFPPVLSRVLRQRFGRGAIAIEARWRLRFAMHIGPDGWSVPERHEEYQDVLQLLLDHADARVEGSAAVARWIAFSCMGEDHLWEDLGLPERPALGALIADCFPALHALNVGNMRWKRFFYKQLCARAGLSLCRSPSCADCSEYRVCFEAPPPL
ncbi:nitrogen fixation protein NifQ [Paludibacterium yongneupense]|uniref:nitrogen fixation protein NifQ n=1 Tax=Paludibacterium yongneupense TaxID=400061 RepID=UPI0004083A2C|nr:nitrogen fixation protein NifQ [Paludibacterium yongneupense]